MAVKQVRLEVQQVSQPIQSLSQAADRKTYTASYAPISLAAGVELFAAGVENGGEITPAASGNNDQVDVAAVTVIDPGMTGANATTGRLTVAAVVDLPLTRPAVGNVAQYAITATSAGAIAVVKGTDHTAFVDTWNAPGGPPYIPVDSVLVGIVKLSSSTSAQVAENEIFQQWNVHLERADYPLLPDVAADAENAYAGSVVFEDAHLICHTGGLAKRVFLRASSPVFAAIKRISEFQPPEISSSSSSTDTIDGVPVNTTTNSISNGSFQIAQAADGVRDQIIQAKGKLSWCEMYPDINLPYRIAGAAYVNITRTFPNTNRPTIAVSLVAASAFFERTA